VHGLARAATAFHDPGFDVVALRKARERLFSDYSHETGERSAHQQRPLLPITSQKLSWRQAAEQSRAHAIDYM
jgi:hypothetical protein